MSAIALNYNELSFEELTDEETNIVSGGEPVTTLTVGAILAIGAAGLVVGVAVAVAVWYFTKE